MRRWVPLGAVAVLLAAAMLAAAFANPSIEQRPVVPRTIEAPPPQAQQGTATVAPRLDELAGEPFEIPSWVSWLVMALCLGAVLTVVGLMIWYYLRDHLPETARTAAVETAPLPTPGQTRRRVREALDEGIADLDDGDADPRRAVIACWVRLEQAAALAGTQRQPGDTPSELVGRLLHEHHVSADVLGPFAGLYRQARFAPQEVDLAMRDQARAALGRLRDELDAAPAGPRASAEVSS